MMTRKLKLIQKNLTTVEEIVSSIKDGTWGGIEKDFDLLQFMLQTKPNEYVINDDKRLQVRHKTIDNAFVNRQVEKVRTTGDRSCLERPVVVFFPEEAEFEGEKISGNSYMLLDRNHGVMIMVELGIHSYDSYILNFKLDIDSSISKLRAIGNGLNLTFRENKSVENGDIKLEYYAKMDEKIAIGADVKLSKEEKDDFVERYPQINLATMGNWDAHHEFGERRKPTKMWSGQELQQQKTKYADMPVYEDYEVFSPVGMKNWDGEVMGKVLLRLMKEASKKALVILYATTEAQAKGIHMDQGRYSTTKIRKIFDNLREYYSLEAIDVIFLKSK
jgi:hypothetical protein